MQWVWSRGEPMRISTQHKPYTPYLQLNWQYNRSWINIRHTLKGILILVVNMCWTLLTCSKPLNGITPLNTLFYRKSCFHVSDLKTLVKGKVQSLNYVSIWLPLKFTFVAVTSLVVFCCQQDVEWMQLWLKFQTNEADSDKEIKYINGLYWNNGTQ